jgi:anaerobic selenocysteine-containing dehydrogenase
MTDPRPLRVSPWELEAAPPPERWDDWTELDAAAWPERVERRYRLVPTICFNCESACGLLAYADAETGEVQRFEGNPVHPGSRGRTCAKGPATLNQVRDPERILHPLKRVGPRGGGRFERTSWDEVLDDLAGRIRRALDEGRHDEVMYHVGRPGEDHFATRMLEAWGVDGHNSHTNVCSAAARAGYALWSGDDRPSPDWANARFLLLLSAHLEAGHYFNPHAQRIVDAHGAGARLAVIDTRLSNTASRADLWVSPWPGTEAALLLGVARRLLADGAIDRAYLERWTNWAEYLEAHDPRSPRTFARFLEHLEARYATFTDAFVAEECRVPPGTVDALAREIAAADGRFASHLWRGAASGNLGGWQVARALVLLHVLTGSYGRPGGVNPSGWDKFTARPSENPPPVPRWNELIWPREWPLAHYEMSFLLPHLLREKERRLEVYFTRVYNPVWTNPDGCSWIRMLEDEATVGCHVALTPIWSETAQWADYVLPMGLGSERHDVMSQETHAGTWVGFRQAVAREVRRRRGDPAQSTLGTNPGEVWEEAEFWIALTGRIDPDGRRGIRRWFASRERPGETMGLDEYYGDVFAGVPGLPEAAASEGLSPLGYMRRYGAFEVPYGGQERFEEVKDGRPKGFATPSGRLEVHSGTLAAWGHPGEAVPGYVRSHVHWSALDLAAGEMALIPTFRLPTLIHTRSGNSKWLQEISHVNPLWIHPEDARRLRIGPEALVRVTTAIGWLVLRAFVTEGIHPGVVACSHHLGRWRLHEGTGSPLAGPLVDLVREGATFFFRRREPVGPYVSDDPDTSRIGWTEAGVHQNLAFPVQPDPVSGMHCWHQKVKVRTALPEDRYGDVFVDGARAIAVYEAWRAKAVPAPGPDGLRRPRWLKRPLKPTADAYRLDPSETPRTR